MLDALVLTDTDVNASGTTSSVLVLVVGAGGVVTGFEGTTSRRDERTVGMGCAARVVVFKAGSNATSGMTVGSNGQIPVFWNDGRIVVTVRAHCRAQW